MAKKGGFDPSNKGPRRKACECCGATMSPGHKCPPGMGGSKPKRGGKYG